ARGRVVRRDLVQPADPDRQAGAARPAPALVREDPAGGARSDVGGQEPGWRLAPGLADRPGPPDAPAGQCEGVPGARVAPWRLPPRLLCARRRAQTLRLSAAPDHDRAARAP